LIRGFGEASSPDDEILYRLVRRKRIAFFERENDYHLPIRFLSRTMADGTRFFEEAKVPEKGGVHSQGKEELVLEEVAVLIE
jgi:hypothetical protein